MFFYLSKILWFLVDPGNLLLIALCVSAGLLWTRWTKVAKVVLTATAVVTVLVTILPIGPLLFGNLENRFPQVKKLPPNITGIIVLWLSLLYPNAKLIFTGGSGVLGSQSLKEADVIKPLLVTLGLNLNRIIFENQSRNTAENATMTKKIIKPKLDQRWLIITSAFHMPRAMGSFRQAGWNAIAYPVDYHQKSSHGFSLGLSLRTGLSSLSTSLHEWMGLTFYWLSGRTNELYPKPRD